MVLRRKLPPASPKKDASGESEVIDVADEPWASEPILQTDARARPGIVRDAKRRKVQGI